MLQSVCAHSVVLDLDICRSAPAHPVCGKDDIKRFNDVLNLHYDHELEHINLILTQDSPAYDGVPSNSI